TLVSTGIGGMGDPKEAHATVRGTFYIHAKHVSATMDGDEATDSYDLRDVPYIQYFFEGYALHGAFWHDDFGKPRSHGCVNLAPADAAWLFGWTDPVVPPEWHGAVNAEGGTLVYTHGRAARSRSARSAITCTRRASSRPRGTRGSARRP